MRDCYLYIYDRRKELSNNENESIKEEEEKTIEK